MIQILVTGSHGQLGSELQKLAPAHPTWKFHFSDVDTLDITDQDALHQFFERNAIDYIVNCAAYTAVDKAETDKELAHRINCDAVRNLAGEAAMRHCKLIHISTDYVFDGMANRPYREDNPVNPQSVYGNTKLLGEKEALTNPLTAIIRTSWLYSSFGNNFVKTMLRLGKERKELNVIFDQIGTPTFAEDLARAILKMITFTQENEFQKGIYHFSNEGVCSWYDFAWEIMHFSKLDCNLFPIKSEDYPSAVKRPFFSVFDKSKIKNTFGVEVPYWKTSLYKCLNDLNH